jgi:DNA-binding CsgD family transcriptional regulator
MPGELGTAMHAVAGRSSRQIADMCLPVWTVESHLRRVYEKLGIVDCHELPGALRDQPIA